MNNLKKNNNSFKVLSRKKYINYKTPTHLLPPKKCVQIQKNIYIMVKRID